IAQKITGKPIADLMDERVFKPLGMSRTAYGLRGRDNATMVPSQAAPAMTDAGKKSWQNWNWNSPYWRNLGAPWGGALGSAADIVRFYREFLEQRGRILKPATEQLTFGHNGSTGTLSWADPDTGTICVVLTSLYAAAVRPHPTKLVSDL